VPRRRRHAALLEGGYLARAIPHLSEGCPRVGVGEATGIVGEFVPFLERTTTVPSKRWSGVVEPEVEEMALPKGSRS
jgi:hypothetical protein